MTPTELKPCPFCGNKAESYSASTRVINADGSIEGSWIVDCSVCNGNLEGECINKATAIERWNHRPAEAVLIEALKYYADIGDTNASPNEGPWGVNSTDFGTVARNVLKQVGVK